MPLRPVVQGPFVKGVIASADPLTQPKGSVGRASNMLFSIRGALSTCDGTAIVDAYGGLPAPGLRGRFEDAFLFTPIGVVPYYLVIAQDPAQHLGPPAALAVSATGTGTLPAGEYFYVVTALDGAGGETTISNEVDATVGANSSITLTWNIVPNAWGYNIYRGAAGPGSEQLLVGAGLPVLQPSPLTLTVSYIDTGAARSATTPILNLQVLADTLGPLPHRHYVNVNLTGPVTLTAGTIVTITGNTFLNGSFPVLYNVTASTVVQLGTSINQPLGSGTGGTMAVGANPTPPLVNDTTGQVVLYKMPNSPTLPIAYSEANIVALFPNAAPSIGVPPSGGTGGPTGLPASTVSGGIVGMTSLIPQMAQFTNRVAMALGNGFSPQIYWDDSGTAVNPAPAAGIDSVSVTADQVTVIVAGTLQDTDPTEAGGSIFVPVGSNVILSGMSDPSYDGVFVVIAVTPGSSGMGSFVIRNPTASGGMSTGGFAVSTTPLINTFVPAYPEWVKNSPYAQNSVVVPTVSNGYYFTAVQAGDSNATTEPTWPTVIGQEVADGTIIWKNAGTVQSSAPAPLGVGHLTVYAGSLWCWNTYPTDDPSGLDGPTALQMSDVDNPFSWNPVNQAFIDKDDGSDGMGLATFTISAEGIPPEGSLVAFKDFAGYQIVGVFGSSNFAIQRIRSDMGCNAPRTIRFVPGFGIMRYAHLGLANFDGVRDQVVSEEVRPYLFASNSYVTADIVPIDPYWRGISYADLTASPAMYCVAIPVGVSGSSNGALTRLLCYDLVLKAWTIIDLPFSISLIYQARSPETIIPLTLFGGFSDGVLQRWQAQDTLWLTGGGTSELPQAVVASVSIADTSGRTPDQKMQFRRVTIRGISNGAASISVTPIVNGVNFTTQTYQIPTSGDFEVFSGVFKNGWRFGAIIGVAGDVEIDRVTYQLVDKALGVPGVIS